MDFRLSGSYLLATIVEKTHMAHRCGPALPHSYFELRVWLPSATSVNAHLLAAAADLVTPLTVARY